MEDVEKVVKDVEKVEEVVKDVEEVVKDTNYLPDHTLTTGQTILLVAKSFL